MNCKNCGCEMDLLDCGEDGFYPIHTWKTEQGLMSAELICICGCKKPEPEKEALKGDK